ncbi:MAG: AbrB/MazE/SpoVT family DNA-binding domain-containing protein [Nitrosotalea sp.]
MVVPDEIMFKTVKVSDKGQIAIPSDMRKTMKIKKGEELLIVRKGDKLLVEKSSKVSKKFASEFDFMLKNAEATTKKSWNNKEDEIWNKL